MVQRPRKRKGAYGLGRTLLSMLGQENSPESACCGKDRLCMIEFWSPGVGGPDCLLGGLARG